MSETAERVARAICKARGIDPDAAKKIPQMYYDTGDDRYMLGVGEPQWRHFLPQAEEFLACFEAASPK